MRIMVADGKGWDLNGVADVPMWGMIRIEKEVGLTEAGILEIFTPLEEAVTAGRDITSVPNLFFTMGIAVWMARLAAGERIGFEDACDFPLSSIRVEMTDAEKAEAEAAEAEAAKLATQPGVRPTVAVPGTAVA